MKSFSVDKETMILLERLLIPENKLIIDTAISTGLRIDDVLSFETEKVKNASSFVVIEKKTGKKRKITLNDKLKNRLLLNAGRKFIFQGRDDFFEHKTRQAVWKDLKRAGKALRIPENVTPHSCRKLFALMSFEKSGDVVKVSRLLNHSDSYITFYYYLADYIQKMKK